MCAKVRKNPTKSVGGVTIGKKLTKRRHADISHPYYKLCWLQAAAELIKNRCAWRVPWCLSPQHHTCYQQSPCRRPDTRTFVTPSVQHTIHDELGWPLSRECGIPRHFPALLPMLSVTHIMSLLVLLSVVGVGMKYTNSAQSRMDESK